MNGEKIYGAQVTCQNCGQPLIADVLLNVWCEDLVSHPHFELVCKNCKYGMVIKK